MVVVITCFKKDVPCQTNEYVLSCFEVEAASPAEEKTPQLMKAYAKHMRKPGVYVGFADLALLASVREKNVLLLVYDDEVEGPPLMKSLTSVMHTWTDGKFSWPGDMNPEPTAPNTWILAYLNGNYERCSFLQLNHFMPLYPSIQFGETWAAVVDQELGSIASKLARAKAMLANCDSDDDEAVKQSLENNMKRLELKLKFFQTCTNMNLLPVEVPGDGDCSLWSLLAVQAGGLIRRNLSTPEHIASLRNDAWLPCSAMLTLLLKMRCFETNDNIFAFVITSQV